MSGVDEVWRGWGIEKALQLDGTDEFVMYAAAVGHPAR
jgi:hypothetical protein